MGAYEKAVDLLERREHTQKEIESKLLEKGFDKADVDEAVSTLLDEGYLSDERFAEVYLRSRLRKTAEGKSLLVMRLTQKGVSKSVAQEAVRRVWEEESYSQSLRREWKKLQTKYGDGKAALKLMQKGFSSSEIRKASEDDDDEN